MQVNSDGKGRKIMKRGLDSPFAYVNTAFVFFSAGVWSTVNVPSVIFVNRKLRNRAAERSNV